MQACQNGNSYTDVLANTSDPVSLNPDRVEFEFYLPCASGVFSLVNIASDCAFFADILLSFLTGYVPRRSSFPEYNMRSIALNYMQDTFAFDAIATFPWEPVRLHPCHAVFIRESNLPSRTHHDPNYFLNRQSLLAVAGRSGDFPTCI